MQFKEAFEEMKKGARVRLPGWAGYWAWDPKDGTIMMHCRPEESDTGNPVMDIRESKRVEYTLSNILSDNWEVIDYLADSPEKKKVNYSFSERCRKTMNEKGIAPADLAKELNAPIQSIVNILEGRVVPHGPAIVQIAEILGVSPEWLYGFDEVPDNPGFMNFGQALEQCVKNGKRITRIGWNGKNMCVAYQPGYPQGIPCNENTANTWGMQVGDLFKCRPYLQLKCADGTFQMWVATQSDILANDWVVVE